MEAAAKNGNGQGIGARCGCGLAGRSGGGLARGCGRSAGRGSGLRLRGAEVKLGRPRFGGVGPAKGGVARPALRGRVWAGADVEGDILGGG